MATTFADLDGNGQASRSFSFPSYKEADIKVEVDNVTYENRGITGASSGATTFTITSYTTTGGGNIVFDTAPANSANKIRIYRDTDVDAAKATFTAGSSVKAADLNNNMKQILYAAQEEQNQTILTSDIKDLAVTTAKIDNDAVTTVKIADDNVTMAKLGSGALPTDITVASANLVDGTIVNADVNASAAIAGTKVTPAFGSQNVSTSGTAATGALTVTGNIAVSGTVDGRDVATDGSKLDGIDVGAKDDQTAAEIRTLVEAATDSNVFTDADHSKLNGIEPAATADQTNAEIKTAYEANANTNEFSDAEQTKLANIETAATADQTASEIKTLLQSDKLELSEMNTTSLDSRYYTETEAEALFLRQDSSETIASGATWSGSDAYVATTAAIDARIIDLVDDVGGFVPIANETSFPTANPDVNNGAGTLVSIKAIGSTRTPSSGTVTISNGSGSNTVTITGCGSTVLTAGFGVIVETTTTLHTYAFHRLVPKATEVTTVAANASAISTAATNVSDINNFYDLYQISTSAPTARGDSSSLQNGDLWFDSSSNKVLMIYDGSSGDGYTAATPNASDLVNINIVAGQLTYQEDLGLITNAINSGSGNNSVNTVAGSISNVNTAATNIAKITTVADDLNEGTSEIDTVATNIANVNTVGNDIANVNSVAGSIANVNTVQGSISNVNTAATNISSINTAASNISNVNNFTDRYQIASSDPSTDGGGNALAEGDLYFNTSADELKVYNGSAWQGGVTATGNFAAVTGSTYTGSNIHNDNVKSIYGTSSDGMEIFHNASDSIINDTGTGSLKLQTGGSTKLEVVSTGVTVTGLVSATTLDGAAGSNLQLDFGSIA